MAVSFNSNAGVPGRSVQSAYEINIDALRIGQVATLQDTQFTTGINETGGVIPWGFAVVADSSGTDDKAVKIISGSGDKFLGIAGISNTFVPEQDANGLYGYPSVENVNVLYRGAIAVSVNAAVAYGGDVYVRHTTSGNSRAGTFEATSGTGRSKVANARYLSDTTGAGLAVVELNGPSLTLS